MGFGQAFDEAARARGLALAFAFDLALGPGFALGLPRAFALALALAFAFPRGLRPGRSGGGNPRPASNHFWHSGGIGTTCGQNEFQIHACMMYAWIQVVKSQNPPCMSNKKYHNPACMSSKKRYYIIEQPLQEEDAPLALLSHRCMVDTDQLRPKALGLPHRS